MAKFTIQTKQTEFLNNAVLKNMDEVLENVAMFDLTSNFKVLNEKGENKTEEFLSFATKKGYKFVNKKEVLKFLPNEVQKFMKKEFRKPVTNSGLSIKFVHPDDIKSIVGFYELWEEKKITIGTHSENKNALIYFDPKDCKIYDQKTNTVINILNLS